MPPLFDYPDSFGAHRASVFSHAGPASYEQMTDTPLAGGDTVSAAEAGMRHLDFVQAAPITDSGTYRVEGAPPASSPSDNRNASSGRTWKLRWVVVATGAEVAALTDLSGETVRLSALGRY